MSRYMLVCWFLYGPCFVMKYLVSFLALQLSSWERERKREKVDSFTLIVFLMYCEY